MTTEEIPLYLLTDPDLRAPGHNRSGRDDVRTLRVGRCSAVCVDSLAG
jgi:hypothetical protein